MTWVKDGSSRKVQHELRPAGIRQKLGKPKHNKIYGLLAELGTHATFEGIRLFTVKPLKKSGKKNQIYVWLGGCLQKDQVIFVHALLMMAVFLTLTTILKIFAKHLHEEDTIGTLADFLGKFHEFIDKRFVAWSKDQGSDVAKSAAMFAREVKTLSKIALLKLTPGSLPKIYPSGEAD